MAQEYVLRSKRPGGQTLAFSLDARGELALPGGAAAPLKVLRREPGGLLTVLWGERVVSGILRGSGESGEVLEIQLEGSAYALTLREAALDAMERGLAAAQHDGGSLEVASPIPGLVKAVPVQAGAVVTAGQTVMVLEAMKMENEIVAPHAGVIAEVKVTVGQAVAAGLGLVVIRMNNGGS